jgi:hypothetical protein
VCALVGNDDELVHGDKESGRRGTKGTQEERERYGEEDFFFFCGVLAWFVLAEV